MTFALTCKTTILLPWHVTLVSSMLRSVFDLLESLPYLPCSYLQKCHLKVTTALERREASFAEVTFLFLIQKRLGSTSSPGPFHAHLPQYDKRPWGRGCTSASPGLSYHPPHKSAYFSNVIWTYTTLIKQPRFGNLSKISSYC